uniref:Uncharacterized protein n=1 Tax=Rhizophora mucronata TaxID=61149 RepID=A0A2P2PCI9_RHIMU
MSHWWFYKLGLVSLEILCVED